MSDWKSINGEYILIYFIMMISFMFFIFMTLLTFFISGVELSLYKVMFVPFYLLSILSSIFLGYIYDAVSENVTEFWSEVKDRLLEKIETFKKNHDLVKREKITNWQEYMNRGKK